MPEPHSAAVANRQSCLAGPQTTRIITIQILNYGREIRNLYWTKKVDTYVLLSFLHLNFLSLLHCSEDAQSALVVALLTHLSSLSDLVLYFLGSLQDVNRQDTLSLDGLTIGAILSLVDHDLGLLDGLNHWLLLHGCEHASWLLDARSHVHRRHACWVTLAIHEHLLLRGIVLLPLPSALIVISLVRASIAVDDSRLSIHIRIAHLTRHTDLLDHALIHWRGLWWVLRHCHLLRVDELLMLGLVLIHALTAHLPTLSVGIGLAQLMHTVSIGAIVGVWASLALVEVLAHDSLVVFKATCVVLGLMAVVLTALKASTTASTASSLASRERIISTFTVNIASHMVATVL